MRTAAKPRALALIAKSTGAKPETVGITARLRRQRVLKPVQRDPFLASISSRKTLQQRRRALHSHRRLSRTPCDPDIEMEAEPEILPSPRFCPGCGKADAQENLENLGSGAVANALYAKQLPERLQRPDVEGNPVAAIFQAGYDPVVELNGLKIARKELSKHGQQLFSAISSTISPPIVATNSEELPAFITIAVPKNVRAEHMPSHMLAVYDKNERAKKPKGRMVLLMPVHAQVLAAQCGRVPPIPSPSIPEASINPQPFDEGRCHTRVVPVLPLFVPSVDTFPLMTHFLCNQDTAQLFRHLVPIGPPGGGMWQGDFSRLAETLANELTGSSIFSGALRIHGFWQNACSMGVLNPAVWNVIDMAWKVHRNALLLAQR